MTIDPVSLTPLFNIKFIKIVEFDVLFTLMYYNNFI